MSTAHGNIDTLNQVYWYLLPMGPPRLLASIEAALYRYSSNTSLKPGCELVKLVGEHDGPPIAVVIEGIDEEVDGDEGGIYYYASYERVVYALDGEPISDELSDAYQEFCTNVAEQFLADCGDPWTEYPLAGLK